MSAKAVFLQAIISFASSKATLSPRLKSGKPAFLGLVEIASALGAAEGERPSVFAAEKRESKIIVLFHKFIGVSLRAHENSHHILAPQLAQHTPADGHGVIVALLTGGEQRQSSLIRRTKLSLTSQMSIFSNFMANPLFSLDSSR